MRGPPPPPPTPSPPQAVWEQVPASDRTNFNDPMVLVDEATQKWYMYSGCSAGSPLHVVELDPHKGFATIGTPTVGVEANWTQRGFEV